MVSETKIDVSFPKFLIKEFSDSFHLDWNIHREVILLSFREDTPTKTLALSLICLNIANIELNLWYGWYLYRVIFDILFNRI